MIYRVYLATNNDQLGVGVVNAKEVFVVAYYKNSKSWMPTAVDTIANAFIARGWIVKEMQRNLVDQWITFKATVYSSYSDGQIQNAAQAIFEEFYELDSISAVTIKTGLTIGNGGVTQEKITGIKTQAKSTTPGKITDKSNGTDTESTNIIADAVKKTATDSFSDFLKSLGEGLGVSAPIVAGSLLVLAVVILRR